MAIYFDRERERHNSVDAILLLFHNIYKCHNIYRYKWFGLNEATFICCRNGYFYLFGAETVTMGAETVRSNKSNLTWGSRNGKNDERPKKSRNGYQPFIAWRCLKKGSVRIHKKRKNPGKLFKELRQVILVDFERQIAKDGDISY